MELGTLMVGIILAWIYRYPFMIMPIAVTLWYMSMDIAAMLGDGQFDFELRAMVSMYFGLITVLIAFWLMFDPVNQQIMLFGCIYSVSWLFGSV